MTPKLRFHPVSHSWVALHPNPKGIIQFVGGALFGTFASTLFYRHLLKYLFDQSYTIILLPFNFTFDHLEESMFLVKEQYQILPEVVRMAIFENYDYQVYLKDSNYIWMGHSIGCKYIALLEAFGTLPKKTQKKEDLLTWQQEIKRKEELLEIGRASCRERVYCTV